MPWKLASKLLYVLTTNSTKWPRTRGYYYDNICKHSLAVTAFKSILSAYLDFIRKKSRKDRNRTVLDYKSFNTGVVLTRDWITSSCRYWIITTSSLLLGNVCRCCTEYRSYLQNEDPIDSASDDTKKAFKRGSSFCSSTRSCLQNEDLIDSASDDTKKAFKRGSSFCSSTRSYLQNEDPIDSASADTKTAFKRGSSFCSSTRSYLQNEDPIDSASDDTKKAFKRGSSFCSSSWSYLQNEDPIDSASADNEQSNLARAFVL